MAEYSGSGGGAETALVDRWRRLATHYRDNARVIFGLMNEPHDMATEAWVSAANASIREIRATGATQRILVPGNAWTGAHAWSADYYGTPNAEAMLEIVDPGQNLAFESVVGKLPVERAAGRVRRGPAADVRAEAEHLS